MKISFDLKIEVWRTDSWDNPLQQSKTVYAGRINKFGLTGYSDSMEGAFERIKHMLEFALDNTFERHGEKGLKNYQDKYNEEEKQELDPSGGERWQKVGEEVFHFEKEYKPA